MAAVRNRLKAARTAIGSGDFSAAQETSLEVLEQDPSNYNANVFLGLASLELGQQDKSEQAYRKAIQSDATSPLAWQGISKLYAQTEQWDKHAESLYSLANVFAKSDDMTKCAETLQKYIDVCKQHLGPLQVVTALTSYLPTSDLYPVLSSLPPPDATNPDATTTFSAQSAIQNSLPIVQEIVQILEKYEDITFTQEVESRRKRLGAPSPGVIRQEVGYEIWSESRLPEFYNEILNHPNTSDELRRETESKLFSHKQRLVSVIPSSGKVSERKAQVSEELEEMVNGIVLLGIPNEPVWRHYIEGQDVYSLEEYDVAMLQKFVALFPYSVFATLILAYFAYTGIPPTADPEAPPPVTIEYEDSFDTIQDSYNDLPDSVFASRILVKAFQEDHDYDNSIKMAEVGLERTRKLESERGKPLVKTERIFNVILGTSLVHYYPPKHHTRALRILDDILLEDDVNVPSLMGRAYILQASKDWVTAAELFLRVNELLPNDVDEGIQAREEHAWCMLQQGNSDIASSELKAVSELLDNLDGREVDQARCWWRMGKCAWQIEAFEQAYQDFVTALKRSSSFAPAFSDLGVYYLEVVNPPDPDRASKCFQKAFELDATQADAARRLAERFADEREWDLVEVVARRTIEGEGGNEQATSKHLPVNSWAWRALGVVELSRKNYSAAIQSLQTSLRGESNDQVGWVRLGEAYARAGRHVAAVKALEFARTLRPDDWICSYLIADVQSQTGQFTEAITSLQSILDEHPSELGVMVALSTAHLNSGAQQVSSGFFARAEVSFLTAIEVALKTMETNSGFSRIAWKIIADALFRYSGIQFPRETLRLSDVLTTLKEFLEVALSIPISKPLVDSFPPEMVSALNILEFAAATYEYRISFGFYDDKAKASAWYDLGVALQTLRGRDDGSHTAITQDQVIHCLKEAASAEPDEELHWITLGDAYFLKNAKSAQHSYIRSLELNSKNVVTWTNLGLLYLHHQDLELANQAFLRAQVLDPNYPLAWLGQGLVASAHGHDLDAEHIFEHIVGLETTVAEADLSYALRIFSRTVKGSQDPGVVGDSLVPAFFVLDRYCQERPNDESALHLFGLVCERVGHYDLAVELITKAISILEAKYEESEDAVIERQFTIANTNLGRLRIANSDFEGAVECLETALGLIGDDDSVESRVLRTQSCFVTGLSKFKCGDLNGAMESFQSALGTAGEDLAMIGHISVLLAQALWSLGEDGARESAKSQLLQCISSDPENLEAINLLVGMGILTDDDDLVDAALSEMLSLPLDQRAMMDPHHDVNGLLVKHHLGQGDTTRAFSEAQKRIFAQPSSKELKIQAASLALQSDRSVQALALLASIDGNVEGTSAEYARQLGLRAAAESLSPGEGGESLKLAQKAVRLNPASFETWSTLAFIQNTRVR